MNQSNIIFAYLIIAFIVFITMRGELRTYMGFFFGGGTSPQASGSPKAANSNSAPATSQSSSLGSAAQVAELGMMLLA